MQISPLESLLLVAVSTMLLIWLNERFGHLLKRDAQQSSQMERGRDESLQIRLDVGNIAGRLSNLENDVRKLDGVSAEFAELRTEMRQVRAELRDMTLTFREWLLQSATARRAEA